MFYCEYIFHLYVVCPNSSVSAMPWNCASRIRTWRSNCQRGFLRRGFEASERSCASGVTGIAGGEGRRWIVGGEAMDSPHDNAPRTLR